MRHPLAAAALVLTLLPVACATNPLRFIAHSPRDAYLASLERAGLHETALGEDWIRAGEAVLANAVPVVLPFRETGYFPPDTAAAVAYRVDLPRGRRLSVEVTQDAAPAGRLFVDLFRAGTDGAADRVASMETDEATLSYEVERSATYILRIQPELLRGGRFTVVERTLASIPFPVSGLTASAIQSGFGAQRDAGARTHEGVDIFAPRGTPVVAITGGFARPGTNRLGGNVVWLHDPGGGRTFYYAHLERQAIDGLTRVTAGEVLGLVGNTGNARGTAPHLHFGLYASGAIDPLPFIRPDDPVPAPLEADALAWLDAAVRVTAARTPARDGPDRRAPARATLERGAPARVLGASGAVLRVRLPDASTAYIARSAVAVADAPLRRERLKTATALLEAPGAEAPLVDVLEAGTDVAVLGSFDGFRLLRGPDGQQGWN